MLSARLRGAPSAKVVVMIERPAGTVKAAEAPLTKRSAIRAVSLVMNALANDAAPKTAPAGRQTGRAADEVRRAAAEKEQAAVAEDVGTDDPLQRTLRH